MYKMLIVINLYLSKIMMIYDDYDYDVKKLFSCFVSSKIYKWILACLFKTYGSFTSIWAC